MTAKQLELETGCKIMVRGKGSMRDKKKEEANRGKPNWEHLSEELHVLISVEDTENRAELKLARAVEEVQKLLVPQAEGEDELKKRQLMELAIINGTYRDNNAKVLAAAGEKTNLQDFYSYRNGPVTRRMAADGASQPAQETPTPPLPQACPHGHAAAHAPQPPLWRATHTQPREEANRGKPNWEHLSEELHVLISVEDTENRAELKLARAVEEVQKLLVP
ncbi:protein quaking-like, partial [Diaphorina citri]|uniref:Protein quaking-like n=1 Tax=Diaphorina citri TaxID=121845 RepID=A0A3Q0JNX6_DIACI